MLISKRRLKWGSLLFLAMIAVVLIRPMRSWLDQAMVAYCVDSDLAVREVRLHPKTSVVELRDIDWNKANQHCEFGIRAGQAWLAVDGAALVDRQFHAPHMRVANAELYLAVRKQPAKVPASVWQRELAERFATLDWNDLSRHFGSLLTADSIHQTWTERIEQWSAKSRDIVAQIRSMETSLLTERADETRQSLTDLSNPLRDEDLLKSKLAVLDQLSGEQSALIGQYDSIQKLLHAECRRLTEAFDDELAALTRSSFDGTQRREANQKIAEEIVLELANKAWDLYAGFAEVSESVARGFPVSKSANRYNRDVRLTAEPCTFLELKDLRIDGHFAQRNKRNPFSLQVEMSLRADARNGQVMNGKWDYQFIDPTSRVTVLVEEATERSSGLAVAMRVTPAIPAPDVSPSDWGITDMVEADSELLDESEPIVALNLTAFSDALSGTMQISPDLVQDLSTECQRLFANALLRDASQNLSLAVELEGSWEAPEIKLSAGPPEWLIASIETEVVEQVRSANLSLEHQARSKFEQQLGELQGLAMRASIESQNAMQQYQQQVALTRTSLQDSLDEINGTSFARRPGAAQNR